MLRLLIALLFVAVTTVTVAEEKLITKMDVFELEVPVDPQISPDGSQIVYVRRSMDIMTDRAVSNIWIVDLNGENHRPLLSGNRNYSSPRWSPSGDRLAYIANVEGRGSQIHVRWMDSSQTAVLTNVRQGPSSLTWSPNGEYIAFSMFVEGSGD